MKSRRRFYLFIPFALMLLALTACQSPCSGPPASGTTRYNPTQGWEYRLQFDYPSEWRLKAGENLLPAITLEKPDASGAGRSVLVLMNLAGAEEYPHILSEGRINSQQDWGDPFPSLPGKTITRKEARVDGHPALKISIDFEAPVELVGTETPVNSWGYMQNVYVPVKGTVYDLRFYAADSGEEALLRKQFDKLLASVCVLP